MARGPLKPHRFIATRDGHRSELVFYARNATEGAAMALDWGKRRGYKMFRKRKAD